MANILLFIPLVSGAIAATLLALLGYGVLQKTTFWTGMQYIYIYVYDIRQTTEVRYLPVILCLLQ